MENYLMKNEKIDLTDNSQDKIRLTEVKEIEKKMRKLQRVDIPYGYVLTNNPSKWDDVAAGRVGWIHIN